MSMVMYDSQSPTTLYAILPEPRCVIRRLGNLSPALASGPPFTKTTIQVDLFNRGGKGGQSCKKDWIKPALPLARDARAVTFC